VKAAEAVNVNVNVNARRSKCSWLKQTTGISRMAFSRLIPVTFAVATTAKQYVHSKDVAMNTYYPLCAFENLQIEETGAEVILVDSNTQTFHLLNPTAYAILKACNGSNTIRDIAVMLSREFDIEDVDSIEADVTETIKAFESKGLMWFVTHESPASTIESGSSSDSPLLAISVTGASMFPVLFSDDKVLVKKCSLEELNVGDIVVWTDASHKHVAHRIVFIDTSSTPALITTKGDVSHQADAPVEFDRVVGKVVAVLQDGELKWMKDLENKQGSGSRQSAAADQPRRRPSYALLKVLDLREVSVDSIKNIESVTEVSLVLLSPENEHAWSEVAAKNVKAVFTAPREYRVYTGQPELLPEILEFMEEPLRLIVMGQLFLTSFEPQQIQNAFRELIVVGQVYVSSEEAKSAVESIAKKITGGISIVPAEHARWIGESILGPEYLSSNGHAPIVAIGDLSVSERMNEIPSSISLYR
jgi:signal peptidase I